MEHVIWHPDGDLDRYTNPVAVMAFTGWNDAGDAASIALATLAEVSDAELVATIDPEVFTDFATVRPSVKLDDEHHRTIEWPEVKVFAAKLPGTDVLLITGPEPALRWRLFCEQIIAICERAGSPMAISLGALLADVPHTRPVQIIGTSSDTAVLERFELRRSQYEGPTGIVGVLNEMLRTAGIPSASLWAAVPGYAAQMPSPPAALALVERACQMMGTPPPTVELAGQVDAYRQQVSSFIDDDADLITYVDRLETMYDEGDLDEEATPPTGIDASNPEQLANEVEQFLRDQD